MINIRTTFLIAVTLILAMSCGKEYLETKPSRQVADEQVFSNIENAKAALNGIYRFMFQRTTIVSTNVQNKPGVGGILLGLDFMGEDVGIATATWYTSTGEGNWNAARNDNHNVNKYYYRTFYKIVGDANQIIERVDDLNATIEEKNSLKAQAYALRAYAYSYLVQLYAKRYDARLSNNNQLGVPLVLKSTDFVLPRATVEEVYESIINDLDSAINLNVTKRTNKSQIISVVAKGLRARVALTMQDYPNAIKYSKEVIDSQLFPLMSIEDYQKGFNDATIGEYMWAMMPTVDQDDTFGSFFAQIAYNANTTYMRGTPKRINSALYQKISATDVRKKMWEPTPTEENFPLPTSQFTRQDYMSRKFSIKQPGTALGDVSLMRSSEMHLILAEAYASASQPNYALAQEALFHLMKTRDLNAVKSNNTGQALLDEIWINRRVELWGEGFRYLDLKRLNQPLNRTVAVVPNYVGASVNNLVEIPAGDDRWQFLFPLDEINANPEIIQND